MAPQIAGLFLCTKAFPMKNAAGDGVPGLRQS